MSAVDPAKLAQVRAMFGIPSAATMRPSPSDVEVVLLKQGESRTIDIDLSDEGGSDEISIKSIIKDKPATKEVRQFFADNLMELDVDSD